MAGELAISPRALRLLQDLRDEWANLDRRISAYDDELASLTREDEMAWRLATMPGIEVINATALLAAVGDARPSQSGGTSPPGQGSHHATFRWWQDQAPRLQHAGRQCAHLNAVVVALAAELARIAWTVLRHGRDYEHRAAIA